MSVINAAVTVLALVLSLSILRTARRLQRTDGSERQVIAALAAFGVSRVLLLVIFLAGCGAGFVAGFLNGHAAGERAATTRPAEAP